MRPKLDTNLDTLECLAGKEVHDDVKRYIECEIVPVLNWIENDSAFLTDGAVMAFICVRAKNNSELERFSCSKDAHILQPHKLEEH